MATVYTKVAAIDRAAERAAQNNCAYCVYRHRTHENDFIVRNAATAWPENFILTDTITPAATKQIKSDCILCADSICDECYQKSTVSPVIRVLCDMRESGSWDSQTLDRAIEILGPMLAENIVSLTSERDMWRRRAERLFWLLPDETRMAQIKD